MLTLTDVASRKLSEVVAQQNEHRPVFGLRVSVESGCCSGPQYALSLAERAEPDDWVGEFAGVRVLVDPGSARLLEGGHIDYVETLQASGFTISKANVGCGCGCSSGAAGETGAVEGGTRSDRGCSDH